MLIVWRVFPNKQTVSTGLYVHLFRQYNSWSHRSWFLFLRVGIQQSWLSMPPAYDRRSVFVHHWHTPTACRGGGLLFLALWLQPRFYTRSCAVSPGVTSAVSLLCKMSLGFSFDCTMLSGSRKFCDYLRFLQFFLQRIPNMLADGFNKHTARILPPLQAVRWIAESMRYSWWMHSWMVLTICCSGFIIGM